MLWFEIAAKCGKRLISLCTNFHDRAFENVQRLLDQRIILEIILVERNGRRFFLGHRQGRSRRFSRFNRYR